MSKIIDVVLSQIKYTNRRRALKIVISVNNFDSRKGYLEYYLARELAKKHQISVFTFSRNRFLRRYHSEDGFEIIRLPYYMTIQTNKIPCYSGVSTVTNFIKSEKPDVIHCQPIYSPLSLLFVLHPLASRFSVVGSVLTGGQEITLPLISGITLFRSLRAKFIYSALRLLINRCLHRRIAKFFALNYGWREVLTHLFSIKKEQIAVIPLGADPDLFRYSSEARKELRMIIGFEEDDIVIVFSGRITPSKMLHKLVLAISPIMKENKKVKLLLVGSKDPAYYSYLIELCNQEQISGNLILHQPVHRTKLPQLFSASDIAVWPGGPSVSMVEALSVGLPIIVPESIITNPIISYRNGLAFRHDEQHSLQKQLSKLISDESLRREMGKLSRKLVEQRLNWGKIASEYASVYSSVLK